MALREVVLGGVMGELVTAACAWLVGEARISNIVGVNSYQHKQREADTVPFLAVYSDDSDIAGKAAGYIYNNWAIYPERMLEWWSLERVIVTENSRHYAKGIVIFRGPEGQALRVRVEIEKHFASNGNCFKVERLCHGISSEEVDFLEKASETELV